MNNEIIQSGHCSFGENCQLIGKCVLDNCILGDNVIIEDSKLYNCKIKDNVIIRHNSVIYDTLIDNNSTIISSYIEESYIGEHCKVGPYAHLRPKTNLLGYNKVGSYVETKNATLGIHTTASHLAYIGDATVGKYCSRRLLFYWVASRSCCATEHWGKVIYCCRNNGDKRFGTRNFFYWSCATSEQTKPKNS